MHGAAEGFEAAIEARLDGGKRCGQHAGDFFEAEFFLKTEDENFAIDGRNAIERRVHADFFFRGQDQMQRRRLVLRGKLYRRAFLGVGEGIEALHFFLALPVDDQIAGDAEKPGLEFVLAVVLIAALENTNPGFLGEVFGALTAGGQIKQVAKEAILILLDQLVEEIGVAALKPLGEGLVVVGHLCGEEKN